MFLWVKKDVHIIIKTTTYKKKSLEVEIFCHFRVWGYIVLG
jgi:hypothetical protein